MKSRLHLSYANVTATIALFIALGGGTYAAFNLPKNSVKSSNIKNGQVKSPDLAGDGKFKSAGLPAQGLSGCVASNQWTSEFPDVYGDVGYYRDDAGVVHLHGWAMKCGTPASGDTILTLAKGYQPANIEVLAAAAPAPSTATRLQIDGANVFVDSGVGGIFLDGVSFRCAPSGKSGCP